MVGAHGAAGDSGVAGVMGVLLMAFANRPAGEEVDDIGAGDFREIEAQLAELGA